MAKRFRDYLTEQCNMHPSMQAQDVMKMCFQAAYGAEHLLQDEAGAKAFFMEEFYNVEASEGELAEHICEHYSRLNLAQWKYYDLPAEWAFRLFVLSAQEEKTESDELFADYLKEVLLLVLDEKMPFDKDAWDAYLMGYLASGQGAVRHTPFYRMVEKPAYRIISKAYAQIIPVLFDVMRVVKEKAPLEQETIVVAIDGRAASGKSTLAKLLSEVIDTDVVHVDDFFLPPSFRTEERLSEPGGNVHYERFAQEVLPYIKKEEGFSYRRFDCSLMDYGKSREIRSGKIRIIEGSYSSHPYFGRYMDHCIFLDVSSEEQMKRIEKRNGTKMAEMFEKQWIPMEEKYFETFDIEKKADAIYSFK